MADPVFAEALNAQLSDALEAARSNGEYLGGGFSLVPATNQKSRVRLRGGHRRSAHQDANLLILENQGVVQFAFPSPVTQPMNLTGGQLQRFSFFPVGHLVTR